MKELLALTDKFETSRPVFRLTMDRGDSTISANTAHPVYRYRPEPEDNVLSKLVCDNYYEQFTPRDGVFVVDKYKIASRAMETIRNDISKFLEKNLKSARQMKNPSQSKVYRWYYRGLPNSDEFNDTMIMVYKYMRTFCNDSMYSSRVDHSENTIALLEAIMEKYEQR